MFKESQVKESWKTPRNIKTNGKIEKTLKGIIPAGEKGKQNPTAAQRAQKNTNMQPSIWTLPYIDPMAMWFSKIQIISTLWSSLLAPSLSSFLLFVKPLFHPGSVLTSPPSSRARDCPGWYGESLQITKSGYAFQLCHYCFKIMMFFFPNSNPGAQNEQIKQECGLKRNGAHWAVSRK